MKEKSNKNVNKTDAKSFTVRISGETKKVAEDFLKLANKKIYGRKVRLSELLEFAVKLVGEDHVRLLQERSLSSDDRKELMRQKYIKTRGPISKVEFTDFQMTAAYIDFLSEQLPKQVVELSI